MTTNDPPGIEWAGFTLPVASVKDHFCIVGSVGSGKTLLLHSLIKSVLPHIRAGSGQRAVVFDPKGDVLANLQNAGASCSIRILNLSDPGAFNWDLASDLTDVEDAKSFADILVPTNTNETRNDFFAMAARHLLSGILQTFIAERKAWTLQELVSVSDDKNRLFQVLSSNPRTSHLVDMYSGDSSTLGNILVTLAIGLQPLKTIVASEEAPAKQQFTFTNWHKNDNSILVVSLPCAPNQGSGVLTQLFVHAMSRVLLRAPEHSQAPTTWIFMDGFNHLPRMDSIGVLLTQGRSGGVRIAMTLQEIESPLRTYGNNIGGEILSSCSNLSFLRATGVSTAEWASKKTSDLPNFEYQPRNSAGSNADGGFSEMSKKDKSLRPRPHYRPSEFLNLPMPRQGAVTGCHIIPALGGSILRETRHLPSKSS